MKEGKAKLAHSNLMKGKANNEIQATLNRILTPTKRHKQFIKSNLINLRVSSSKQFPASISSLTLPLHNLTYRTKKKKEEEEEDYQKSCCPLGSAWWPHLRHCKVMSKVDAERL